MSFYRERFGHREGEFPVCEDVAARSLALPFFPEMSEGQVARVRGGAARDRCAAGPGVPLVDSAARCPASTSRSTPSSASSTPRSASTGGCGPYDVELSRAHAAHARRAARIIAAEDRDELLAGLDAVEHELERGHVPVPPDDEDIHMAIERRLTELAGPVGGKLHTARSRNDQVATDMALFARAHAQRAAERDPRPHARARRRSPSATSTGRCPATRTCSARSRSTSATTCSPTFWMLARDARPLRLRSRPRAPLPLGAGALAGVNFDTDRRLRRRGARLRRRAPRTRSTPSPNRDFVLDYLAAAATCATHLSRLGAEIVLWSSDEFGFAEVSDALASGSSIMPQKKNPDAAELLRAKAPRIAGHLVALHGVMHALPLTYNKDMQEDKEHLFDAVDTLELCLAAATGMLERDRLRPRAAGRRPRRRVARRDRRRRPARAPRRAVPRVRTASSPGSSRAVDSGRTLSELRPEELAEHSDLLDDEYYAVLARREPGWSRRSPRAAPRLRRVREQLAQARALLG